MRRQWLGGVATLTVCVVALVADAQVPLRCGPAGRGRAAADGARCECVAPLFAERVVAGVRRCVPTPAPARAVRPRVELTCPAGEHRSDDHCCAAGHAWVRETSRCVCIDAATCGAPAVAAPAPTAAANGSMIVGGGPNEDVASRMAQQARRFASGHGAASDLFRVTVRQGADGIMVPGQVQPGYCYRVIAVGSAGVRDLDLFLYDGTGRQIEAASSAEGDPVIGLVRPLCIPPGVPPQGANVRVRSFSSGGPIGVRMFARPFSGQVQ